MHRATDIAELGVPYGWWQRIEKIGDAILVEVDDPDGDEDDEGCLPAVRKILRPAEIHAAFRLWRARGKLCCGDTMAEHGYDHGCADDADLILQQATFGESIYA